jgi:hypothetical protein
MSANNKEDRDVIPNDVDLTKSDIALYYESDELNSFKHKPMFSPFNPGLKKQPLNTKSDQYSKAQRVKVS